MATNSCDSTAIPSQGRRSDVTEEDVKAQETLLRKLRQEGASKENASLSLTSFSFLTNQNVCKGTPHVMWCNGYCYAKAWAFKQSYCNPLSRGGLRVYWFHQSLLPHYRLMQLLPNWSSWKALSVPMHLITLSSSAQRYLCPSFYLGFVFVAWYVCTHTLENNNLEHGYYYWFVVEGSTPL